MQLSLNGVRFIYPGSMAEILSGVTVAFPCGWTGVVGDNGCGKSTLARIAAGVLLPDSGDVIPPLFGTYCEQGTEHAPEHLSDFSYDYGSEAVKLRNTLGIEEEWLWRYRELSCGQRKRIQVAVSLWLGADVLAIDSPPTMWMTRRADRSREHSGRIQA